MRMTQQLTSAPTEKGDILQMLIREIRDCLAQGCQTHFTSMATYSWTSETPLSMSVKTGNYTFIPEVY